jgi:hypothetical protein
MTQPAVLRPATRKVKTAVATTMVPPTTTRAMRRIWHPQRSGHRFRTSFEKVLRPGRRGRRRRFRKRTILVGTMKPIQAVRTAVRIAVAAATVAP